MASITDEMFQDLMRGVEADNRTVLVECTCPAGDL